MHLEYQKPFLFDRLLEFFRVRTLAGVELVGDDFYMRTASIPVECGRATGWIRVRNDEEASSLVLETSESLKPVEADVAARVRRLFDLDCDPAAVAEGIAMLDDVVAGSVVLGTRLPGCFEPFETACRAVLGQQVSVVAANKLAARIIVAYGSDVDTGVEGLDSAWPTPEEVLALGDVEEAFGELGVIRTRSRTIAEIASMMVEGELDLSPDADAEEQIARLVSVKGIGPWTANYIAMRAMSHPDAFLESDVGVKHALPDLTPKQRLELAESWRPWRSYANISLWNSLG